MAEGKAKNEMVMVFIGKRNAKKKDKTVFKKDIFSLMKKATADKIGVPAGALRSGVTEKVEITKGNAKGATYDRPVKGARGEQWKFVYPGTSGEGTTKKNTETLSVGFPTGTPAGPILVFAETLSKKPLKIISPRGVTHHLEG